LAKKKTIKEKTEKPKPKQKETTDKPDRLELFDVLNNLYTKKQPPITNEENFKETYMLQRFLSMRKEGFWPVQFANTFSNKMPPWAVERLLYHIIAPRSKAPFGKYIKPPAGEKVFPRSILARLGRVFSCNLHHAEQTAVVLTKEGVDVYSLFGEKAPTKRKKDGKEI
jgi:hypothetical protein